MPKTLHARSHSRCMSASDDEVTVEDGSMLKRGLNYAEAMVYVGVKRKTFDARWRPRLTTMSQGSSLIFDRLELDRLFDTFKQDEQPAHAESWQHNLDAATSSDEAQNPPWNGRPITAKGVLLWASQPGASSPTRAAAAGRSTAGTPRPDFASVASLLLKKRKGG
ncbi:hypothetical protein MW290_05125 [Aquincola tertiaricarbonis]|uniref:Uncharacterized protein n=1 Tax=Aquincola tertiaricarbonis TaxID=391953 RepID=A0ABY4S7H7_AQUTE|nr:hypothetical protein [Aquincola tertiaricarbonis]URI07967.1 hypothetical protein MW290_05125 [Aquincola tertiaricarbonis]